MGKIGDLFVRLGLKSDGFKKGMQDAKKETQSFGSKLQNMKAGALAVWAAIGTAVIKFAQDFISSTNQLGDAWERNMRGIKNSWQTVKGALTSGDFKNFGKNIADAFKAGKDAADAADAEFELVESAKLQRQAIQQELNELYAMMRDTSLSNADRQAAADRYKALLQPIADAEIEVYRNMMSTAITEWTAGTNLNRTQDEIVEFFMNIGTNAQAMAAKFPDIFSVFNSKKGDKTNLPIFEVIGKFQEASNIMSNVDKEMSRTTNSIRANIKRELDSIADAVKKYGKEDLKLDLSIEAEFDWEAFELAEEMDNAWQEIADAQMERINDMVAQNEMLEQAFIESFSGATQAVTDALFNLEGAGAEQVLAALMQPFARTATQLGEMLIAQGIGIKAFKESLKTLQPGVAIAAGAALIALGAALSSGIQSLAGGAAGGTSASTASAGSSATSGIETYQQDITVHVVGEISGDKIVLAGQKTLNKWSR